MKKFCISTYDKYIHFVSIDLHNLFESLRNNLLIILIFGSITIILAFLICKVDYFYNPILYIIGKILTLPIATVAITSAILTLISLSIITVTIAVVIAAILLEFIYWLCSLY